jgi:hypothetical protein
MAKEPENDWMLCPFCSSKKKYNEIWDSYYCSHCRKWLEVKCGDADCAFCKSRPQLPDEVPGE